MPSLKDLEDQADRALQAQLDARNVRIAIALKNALNDIRLIMSKTYEKYSRGGVLTRADMTQYNRLVSLEVQLFAALDPALKVSIKEFKRLHPEMYQASFFRYAWAMDNSQGVRLNYGTLNLDSVAVDLNSKPFMISMKNYVQSARQGIELTVNTGIAQGMGYAEMARGLAKVLNSTYDKALTITRTEGQTAINAGQDVLYSRAVRKGIEGNVKWDATKDARTRPDHGAADGQIRADDGTFTVGGEHPRYPGDEILSAGQRIRCRCREAFEVTGYSPQIMRTRDKGIVPYQMYTKYAEQYHPEWLKVKK